MHSIHLHSSSCILPSGVERCLLNMCVVLNVCVACWHRVILTRENVEAHQHAVSVVRQVVRAAQEMMDSDRARAKGQRVCVCMCACTCTHMFLHVCACAHVCGVCV